MIFYRGGNRKYIYRAQIHNCNSVRYVKYAFQLACEHLTLCDLSDENKNNLNLNVKITLRCINHMHEAAFVDGRSMYRIERNYTRAVNLHFAGHATQPWKTAANDTIRLNRRYFNDTPITPWKSLSDIFPEIENAANARKSRSS